MIVQRFGQKADSQEEPVKAAWLCLRGAKSAAESGFEAGAWAWAADAVDAARIHSEALATVIRMALDDTQTHLPNTDAAIGIIEQYKM
jgi:hypothetical protein